MCSPMPDDLPEHCPITVNKYGHGPECDEPFVSICWCGDPYCMKFYGSPT